MSVLDRRVAPAAHRVAFMSYSGNLKWFFIVFLVLLIVVYKQMSIYMNEEFSIFTMYQPLFLIFSFQSLVAEAFGIRLNKNGISAPRQLAEDYNWLVFWRETFRWEDIERINSLSGGKVRMITTVGRIDIRLKNRDEKFEFFRAAKKLKPSLKIGRGT